ncbi:MAG: 50S ribosomal protein L24 [uncultured bacterium]|uniref:Large ribosomal subunit protein uL24 n=1 Tax=Candidatus Wallbacteria bacterium GWC2_49_35 TaxID=1817813 RepID=A0A1F7WHG2_9BACT|nr:ribosomal protein L24 [uncultured bacterium]EKD69565.1 MAG: 50S ribosomal protein L24 [uncultured bacterium]OGM02274.1 MAG: 50S ribosomal protein L24 [Candidatus Wallbacteria bacterium GWC2_49_35]HBC75272.1 50S ribosomal protein L24 [Candidatus Wallbacteria bacterium]
MCTVKTELKKGDLVRVMCGKNEGKQGKILVVNRAKCKLIVEGINLVKKHQKPSQKVQKGGIIEREGFIYATKVMLVCPKCSKPTRIAHFVSGEGKNSKKVRSCKKCSEMIDQI